MPEAGSLDVLLVQDLHQRAQLIIRAAESQGMKTFVTADDIVAVWEWGASSGECI